jgi:hypothetical protein
MRSISKRRCSKRNRRSHCRVAEALGRGERSAENKRIPVRDVDVDFLHQSRRAKSACRTEAHPRSGERKIASPVRAQSLVVVRRPESAVTLIVGAGADRWKKDPNHAQATRATTPPPSAESAARDHDREGRQPYATEVEDYKQGVASPPDEQRRREANPGTTNTRTKK